MSTSAAECIELCQSIIDQEKAPPAGRVPRLYSRTSLSPRNIKEQARSVRPSASKRAKKFLSVAVHNHYKRLSLGDQGHTDVEVDKSNILLDRPPQGAGTKNTARPNAGPASSMCRFAIGPMPPPLTEAGYVGEGTWRNLLLKLAARQAISISRAAPAAALSTIERR